MIDVPRDGKFDQREWRAGHGGDGRGRGENNSVSPADRPRRWYDNRKVKRLGVSRSGGRRTAVTSIEPCCMPRSSPIPIEIKPTRPAKTKTILPPHRHRAPSVKWRKRPTIGTRTTTSFVRNPIPFIIGDKNDSKHNHRTSIQKYVLLLLDLPPHTTRESNEPSNVPVWPNRISNRG